MYQIEPIEVLVPDGKSGVWEIDTFTVDKKGADMYNLQCLMNGRYYRQIEEGTYKRLSRDRYVVMSNTPAEVRDHRPLIKACEMLGGSVLINGLGLGMALGVILKNKHVDKVTVIEKEQDVINLTAPTFKHDERVTIICADALTWKAPVGEKYSAVWHDIWDNICAKNLPTMATLHRKYGRRCEWQWSWCRKETHALR